jgi:hypothetical protein
MVVAVHNLVSLLTTDDAVRVASTKPYSVERIDPKTNTIVADIFR